MPLNLANINALNILIQSHSTAPNIDRFLRELLTTIIQIDPSKFHLPNINDNDLINGWKELWLQNNNISSKFFKIVSESEQMNSKFNLMTYALWYDYNQRNNEFSKQMLSQRKLKSGKLEKLRRKYFPFPGLKELYKQLDAGNLYLVTIPSGWRNPDIPLEWDQLVILGHRVHSSVDHFVILDPIPGQFIQI